MALDTNFNVNPYYDDYDEDKKFLRMLFKPGYAVQARELTQLQTILQKQVDRFGQHIFKNGSVVTGGETVFQNTTYINVSTTYAGSDVNIDDFAGVVIVDDLTTPTKKAQVIKVFDTDLGTGDPKTLLVSQIFGTFTDGDTIISSATTPSYANIATSGTGTGQTFSVNNGVYYYDGFFIQNDAQSVAVSKYTQTGNARIGFEITESIVTSTSDTSLLDPAQNASNYQAPGSDRYKIVLTLATRSLDSIDDTKFIELARVENGSLTKYVKYPLYSVLEDTLARRTFDESGNYTVKPFKLALQNSSNTANLDVILSPGKAYVFGYEYETISPTTITIEKPRQFESTNNKRITADYGYYVYANTLFGSFPINSLEAVDLHCVPNSKINITSTNAITNTKIGTAIVKSIEFDSSTDTANTLTYSYKLFLTDVEVTSITGGNCNTGIAAGNTSYVQIANTVSGSLLYSTVDDAYTGAKFRIIAGPGAGETPKTITNYKGSTQTIKLSEPFVANINSQSTFSIDFDFGSVESFVVTDVTTRIAAADVDPRSKDPASAYYSTYISDSKYEPLLFKPGEAFLKEGSITDMSYSYRRLYASQSFSTGQSPALSVGTGESLTTASSTSAKQLNYQVIVTSQGTGAYAVGQTVPATAITTVDTITRKITVANGGNMTANIYATIDVSSPTQKNKLYVAGNTTTQTSGGDDMYGDGDFKLWASYGQLHIASTATGMTKVRTPNRAQTLFTSDVVSLISVLDFNGNAITEAETGAINVTSRFVLVDGQKDSYYDHAAIKLIPGQTAPTGPLVIKFNQFVSSGAGFFDVTSYTSNGYPYESIPSYTASNGTKYELRDVLDFRPVRANNTSTAPNGVYFDVDSTTTGPKIPENGSDILLDYSYYLPRNDKVVLNRDKTFSVVKGDSSITPIDPPEKDNAMTLYVLRNQAYGLSAANTQVQYIDNKRYTMRDIGNIEKRVTNLEYYTSLSLLEQNTLTKSDLTILDGANLPRFKNGILVDSFKGSSIADVFKNDYEASIDRQNFEMRPTFNVSSYSLEFDSANSASYTQNGAFITVSSTVTSFIDQPKASKTVNVNPFNVVNYLGKIELNPKQDIWIDTTRKPDVLVNLNGDYDAWQYITKNTPVAYEWNSWQTVSTGISIQQQQYTQRNGGWVDTFLKTTTSTTQQQTRTGVTSTVVPATITQTLGDRVVDLSIIPYMRSSSILVTGSDFKPSTTLYPFFDNSSVENYVARANKLTLAKGNLGYQTTTGNYETATIYNNTTSTTNGIVTVVKTSNSEVFVVNPTSVLSGFNLTNANLIGQISGTSVRIIGYDHYSGQFTAANTTNLTLAVDAESANNITDYNGATIYITAGAGVGQSRTIQSYNPATRNVIVTSAFTTTPVAANSVYSIGRLKTTAAGDIAGVFTVPASTFRVGEKQLRLIDNSSNDVGASATNGDISFFAQGLLQTVQNDIVSATVPTIQRVAVKDNRVVSSTTTQTQRIATQWVDPLAETFLVAPGTYPNGVFINRARFCFKTKDDVIPVTLQIRPTVNGYPSYSVIYPYATVTLTPDKVQTTDYPDLDDSAKYTEFIFDTPVYIQPGEHSFVLLSNSNKYEVYAAEIGKLDLVSGRQISEQPYGGSLFLSQNGSTWTADQNSDMTFRIYRNQFSQTPATAAFKLTSAPTSNVPYDLVSFVPGDLASGSTSIAYKFNTTQSSTGSATGYLPITAKENYEMTDSYGRRVLTNKKDSFKVQATMTTTDPAVSPIIDVTRMGIIAVENIINDLPLSNSGIVISDGGTMYASPTVTITGGGGSGATAVATLTGDVITGVTLTNPGSGYTTSPTFTITDGSGYGAVVTYNGEDKKSGGNANVRYITRKVTLADGFDSGDLRVYLTAYKPSGSNILVYYKILASSDTDDFDDKNYQLMTQIDNTNFVSTSAKDYREFTFAPGVNGSANNSVTYTAGSANATSYNTFRSFAIKIVLTGTDTVNVPKVRDFRAIALPEGTV